MELKKRSPLETLAYLNYDSDHDDEFWNIHDQLFAIRLGWTNG